jgi:hypothetical protein
MQHRLAHGSYHHANLQLIRISEASEIQIHVNDFAAASFVATTCCNTLHSHLQHAPVPHKLRTGRSLCACCAVNKQHRSATLPSCTHECCMHTVMLIACKTVLTCAACSALPCSCACAFNYHSLVARALPQQHQVSVGVACISGMLA